MKHILLYGDSIFLTGLAARLGALPEVEAYQQAPHTGPLNLSGLDAVIVDFNAVETADVLALLRVHPGLHVVSINAAASAVTVLTGQVFLAQSVEEVTRTIGDL